MTELICTNPKAYEAWELEAYASGESIPHLKEHLTHCAWCQSKLADIKHVDTTLTQALYRFDCPPYIQLGLSLERVLNEEDQTKLDEHLAICPVCSAEFIELRQNAILEPLDRPEESTVSVKEKISSALEPYVDNIKVFVASLAAPQPAMAPAFRGKSDNASLLFTVEDLMVSLILIKTPIGKTNISGQILTNDIVALGSFQLVSMQDGLCKYKGKVNEEGVFVADNIMPGEYRVHITSGDRVIFLPNVSIDSE